MERDVRPGVAVETLTADVCWALLRTSELGRLAVAPDGCPDIFPVNFLVDHGSVVFRTAPGSKLTAALGGSRIAFEVDGSDAVAGKVWSVVLKGRLELVRTLADVTDTAALPLWPWHDAPKPCFVRIAPDDITGRRFVPTAPSRWDTAFPSLHPAAYE